MGDKQNAVNIGVTLSSQLISASLTMIAVLGAFATFIIDKREVGFVFYVLAGSSFFSFIASIFLGGKGINKARESGFNGKWDIQNTKQFFNCQAILCGLGLFFFVLCIFIGKEKSSTQLQRLSKVEKDLSSIQITDSLRQIEIKHLKEEMTILKKQLEDLKIAIKTDTIKKN